MRAAIRAMVDDLVNEVVEAEDGAGAIAAYFLHRPAWVTMDLTMRPVDGLTAVREIKSRDPLARIIIVTVHDTKAFCEAAREAGAIAYIIKDDLEKIRDLIAPPGASPDSTSPTTKIQRNHLMKKMFLARGIACVSLAAQLVLAHPAQAQSTTPGNALSLDGSSGFVSTANKFDSPQTLTISIWFNTTTTQGGRLIGLGDSQTGLSVNYDRHLYMDDYGHILFGIYDSGYQTISNNVACNDGNWHQAVGTLSSGTGMSLYIDGVLATNQASYNTAQNSSGWWKLGWDRMTGWPNAPTSPYFKGTIDEAQIWDVALTAEQIQANLHLFRAGTESGLVSYWHFDEGSGATTADSTSYSNTGTLQGGVSWVKSTAPIGLSLVTTGSAISATSNSATFSSLITGNYQRTGVWLYYGPTANYGDISVTGNADGALAFDGSANNYVSVPVSSVPTGTSRYTVEAWFYATGFRTDEGIVGWGNWGTGDQVTSLRLDADGIRNDWWGDDCTETVATNLLGAWHHAAAVFDGTNQILYLDGVQVGMRAPSGTHAVPNTNLQIGLTGSTSSEAQPFHGYIDEVRVWQTNLSQTTISNWMFQGVTAAHPDFSSLSAYWTMNGSPGTNVYDLSGRGNTGVFVGSPGWTNGVFLSNEVIGIRVPGLTNGATVHFQAAATNTAGLALGQDMVYTLPNVMLESDPALLTNGAIFSVTVNPGGLPTSVFIAYGDSTNLGSFSAMTNLPTGDAPDFLSLSLSNLLPNANYFFSVVESNSDGVFSSPVQSFQTAVPPPSVTTWTALDITTNSGLLTGIFTDYGAPATCWFNYGVTTNYGSMTEMGNVEGALGFDGATNNYVSVSNPSVPENNASYTIEAWIKPNVMGNEGIVGWGNWGTQAGVNSLRLDANGIRNDWWYDDLSQTTPTNLTGAWHHVAATCDGVYRTLYLDGVQVGQDQPNSGDNYHSVTADNFEIGFTGGFVSVQPFNGAIDEIRIWGAALSQATITNWMFQGITTNHPNYGSLMAYWTMNGQSASNTFVPDVSGNGNTGVFEGSPSWTSGRILSNEVVGINVTGLSSNTVYHFQAVATNAQAQGQGRDEIFGTPGVTTEPATLVSANGALLNAIVNPGDVATTYYFEYGLTTNYDCFSATNTIAGPAPVDVDFAIANLTPGTTYYFDVVASGAQGVSTGQPMTLTTVSVPTVITEAAVGETTNSVLLEASVNPHGLPTAVYFEYGLTTNYGNFSATNLLDAGTTPETVSISVNNLISGATYFFQAMATNVNAIETGNALYFQAPHSPLAMTAPAASVISGGANLAGTIQAFGADATVWFEYGLTPALGNSTTAFEISNSAIYFDGAASNYVSVPSASAPTNSSLYTIEAWILPSAMGDEGIVGWGNWGTKDQVNSLRLDAHGIRNDWWSDDLTQSVNAPTNLTGAWHHVAATFDGTNRTLYLDGLQVGQDQPTNTHSVSNINLQIGLTGSAGSLLQPFDGAIDEVRIWRTNLTQTTLQNWMFQSVTTNHPNWSSLAAYWTFDDITGTYLPDVSGHGNNGLLIGQPLLTNGAPLTNDLFYVGEPVAGLLPDTNYYFELVTTNAFGLSTGSEESWTDAAAEAPMAATLPATTGTSNDAVLSGWVQTYGLNTTVYFQYGTTTNYGSVTASTNLAANSIVTFNQTLDNLVGNTTYHYQIVATNAGGGASGGDQVFTLPFFTEGEAGLTPLFESSVAWGDFKNEGALDILLTGGFATNLQSQLWQNQGHGHFAILDTNFPGVAYGAVACGDFDNDGQLDILLTGANALGDYEGANSGIAQVWRNLGNGSFSNVNAGLPGVIYSAVALADFNSDGHLDILLSGANSVDEYGDPRSSITQVWQNMGDGTFRNINANLPGVCFGSVAWGDYDNDGRPDILLTGAAGTNAYGYPAFGIAQVWRNMGDGTFSNINVGLPGCFYSSAAWGDFDNDGFLDILLSGTDGTNYFTQVWRNTGRGTFTNINAALPPVGGNVAWGDVDNDGYLDILISASDANFDAYTAVWHNLGNGTFDTNFNSGLPDNYYDAAVAWGDYDHDGRLDVLMAGGDETGVYHNNTSLANTPPSAPTGLMATTNGSLLTLSWNAAADAQTSASGLSYNLRIGTSPGGVDILSPEADVATGYRLIPAFGNVGETLSNTTYASALPGGFYYWSVQAVDTSFAGSPFAAESTFLIPGGPPSISSLASVAGAGTATLSAMVNPLGSESEVSFEWGTTTAYGNMTPNQDLGDGLAFVTASVVLSNLAPNTTYHWRVGAFSINGSRRTADQTFTTGSSVSAPSITGLSVADGAFEFRGEGSAGATYLLQSSTNLTSWVNVTNLVAGTNGLIQFGGPIATNGPQQFFRLSGF